MYFYHRKIIELLEQNLTEKAFKLWRGIDQRIPNCWDKLTSTTKKYHVKSNGEVTTQGEHIYEMLYAAVKIMSLFGYEPNTTDADKLLLAIALHDTMKYGTLGTRLHTDRQHDKYAADMVASNKSTFNKIMTDEQFFVLEEAVRFHSGRWSTDVHDKHSFNFRDYNPETLFVHILDMLSSRDVLKIDVEE
jgi:HD domain